MPTLKVHVIEAKNLLGADMDGSSHPYCVLKTGDGHQYSSIEKKTRKRKNTTSPTWQEIITLNVNDPETENLYVEVFSKESHGKDTSLGTTSISLRELPKGIEKHVWLQLEGGAPSANIIGQFTSHLGKKKEEINQGDVYLGLTAMDFGIEQSATHPPAQQQSSGQQQQMQQPMQQPSYRPVNIPGQAGQQNPQPYSSDQPFQPSSAYKPVQQPEMQYQYPISRSGMQSGQQPSFQQPEMQSASAPSSYQKGIQQPFVQPSGVQSSDIRKEGQFPQLFSGNQPSFQPPQAQSAPSSSYQPGMQQPGMQYPLPRYGMQSGQQSSFQPPQSQSASSYQPGMQQPGMQYPLPRSGRDYPENY